MNSTWKLTIDSKWIAWLVIDVHGAKVNTMTTAGMAEFDELINQLLKNEQIKAVIVKSGKDNGFIAGADIDELLRLKDEADARNKAQTGQEIYNKLASLPVPTVAVINGACMGGGTELALACDYRLVTDDATTSIAVPEVNLGILPGWGGTQRLPKLVGLPNALTMILTGKSMRGKKIYRMGLADGIVAKEFLEEQTRQFVDRILSRKEKRKILKRRKKAQPLIMRLLSSNPFGRWIIYHKSRKSIIEKTQGNYPAPLEALDVVSRTYKRRPLSEGLDIEANAFSRLACTAISRNLVWLFLASKRLKKSNSPDPNQLLEPVQRAGVIGGGIMGGGIAWALSNAGIQVRLQDVKWDAIANGMKSAAKMYQALVNRRRMTSGAMNLAMHRITGTTDGTGMEKADIVIEAIVEDLDIKKKVLQGIEERVSEKAIICTNTSSLPLEELAKCLKHPERFVGLHFFNPVNRMPLVEVVPWKKSSREAVLIAADLVRRMGKTPIVVGDCAGFLVNRILVPYLVESAWMFEEGVDAERIDRVLQKFGMPMGPLTLVDEVGIDVGYKVAKVLEDAYGSRMRVAGALGEVALSGEWMGKKSGRGIYIYNNGHKKLNHDIDPLIVEARQRDGISISDLSDEEIIDRAILIMVNEAARCLEDHVVDDAESLDMAMVMGTGFAPFRGGLLKYADERGLSHIRSSLEELANHFGDRFKPAPLIDKLASKSGTFYGYNGNGNCRS